MATRIQILFLCITCCSMSTTPPLVSEMGSVVLGFISSHNNTQWKKSSSLLYLFMWANKTITEMPLPTDQFGRSIVSDSLQPHGLQHARLPCPSPTPGVCWNSCPSSWWCHPTISSLSSSSPLAFNLSQHHGLFQWVSSSHQLAKVLEFQLQHQSFQWLSRVDFL